MLKRLLCVSTALTFAPWALVSARADYLAPVTIPQMPALTGGDVTAPAASAVHTVNTVKGKTVLPIDGSVPMAGGLQGILGNAFTAPGQTNFTTGGAGMLVQSGPLSYSSIISGGLPQYDAIRGIAYIGAGAQSIGQGSGLAGYAVSDHASTDPGQAFPVGVYGYGRTSKAGTNAWGFNSVAEDAPSGSSPGTVAGITLQNEFDFNVYNSGTVLFGSNVIGTFLAQPATAFGYLCQLNTPTSYTWSSCYTSQDTVTDSFASIGLAKSGANNATVPNNPSQAINISWLDSTSTRRNTAVRMIPGTSAGNVLDISGGGLAGFRAPNLFMPSGGQLQFANSGSGTTPVSAMSTNSDNTLFIGGSANTVHFQTNVLPDTVGNLSLGSTANPFGNIVGVTFQENLSTPASSSAPCTAGQFTDDANYHYVCVAASTWKRVALSAF